MNGLVVFLLFKIPIRFLVGERPAGAVSGVFETAVLSLGAGDLAVRIGLRGDVTVGLSAAEKLVGEGGAFVRKKLTGFCRVSTLDPSGDLSFLGAR